jgi:hypothetical protein
VGYVDSLFTGDHFLSKILTEIEYKDNVLPVLVKHKHLSHDDKAVLIETEHLTIHLMNKVLLFLLSVVLLYLTPHAQTVDTHSMGGRTSFCISIKIPVSTHREYQRSVNMEDAKSLPSISTAQRSEQNLGMK